MSDCAGQRSINLNRFDYATYGAILDALKPTHQNLCFGDFTEPQPVEASRFFIIRHDIDLSPEAALAMAEFEAECGVRATYFLLFNFQFYNLLDNRYCEFPRRLTELGHEVGLHYDAELYARICPHSPQTALHRHAELLGLMANTPIRSIAMHNPSVQGADPFAEGTPYVNAYAKQFTTDITYLSDSCGAWRDHSVQALEKPAHIDCLQLLIHPIFWSAQHAGRQQRLADLLAQRNLQLESGAEWVRAIWANHGGVAEHDRRQHPSTSTNHTP